MGCKKERVPTVWKLNQPLQSSAMKQLQLHSQAEIPQMAPGSQRKSIQEDVLIYIADVAEKLAWGEQSSQHTKRQVKN